MKRTILAFIMIFIIVSQGVCFSEDTTTKYRTLGRLNGRAWVEMSKEAKLACLMGIYNGAAYFRDIIIGRGTPAKLANEAFENLIHIPNATFYEIIDQINSFYADSANVNLPLNAAYEIVNYKIRGESPSKLEEYTAEFRKFFNK